MNAQPFWVRLVLIAYVYLLCRINKKNSIHNNQALLSPGLVMHLVEILYVGF